MEPNGMSYEQHVIWWAYIITAVWLPCYYVPQIRKFLNGGAGVGDWCVRSDIWQLAFRVPALAFSVFVMPSLPLFLSISLDMCGRFGRIVAARVSQRRFASAPRADTAEDSATAPKSGLGLALRALPVTTIGLPFDGGAEEGRVAVTSWGAAQ